MKSPYIEPVNREQQQAIIAAGHGFIQLAREIYRREFPLPAIHFDLKGKTAGMYQVRQSGKQMLRRIRINPWIAAQNFDEALSSTVPHEVAHFIVDCLYGMKKVRPHGAEWQAVMGDFGVVPEVRGSYSLEGIPVRNYRRYTYACRCQSHRLTSVRHKRVMQKKARYLCRFCGDTLQFIA